MWIRADPRAPLVTGEAIRPVSTSPKASVSGQGMCVGQVGLAASNLVLKPSCRTEGPAKNGAVRLSWNRVPLSCDTVDPEATAPWAGWPRGE